MVCGGGQGWGGWWFSLELNVGNREQKDRTGDTRLGTIEGKMTRRKEGRKGQGGQRNPS